jgi:hypothetical protein
MGLFLLVDKFNLAMKYLQWERLQPRFLSLQACFIAAKAAPTRPLCQMALTEDKELCFSSSCQRKLASSS